MHGASPAFVPLSDWGGPIVSSKKQRSSLVRHTGASAARSGQSSAKSARASSRVKPISQIRVGDLVASRDEATGKLVTGKVTATSKRVAFELYEVSLTDASTGKVVERIRSTREHPFYVVGKGWVAARYLGVGNSLVTRAGPSEAGGSGNQGLVVSGLKRSFYPQGIPVYNFEVEGTHCYFVGIAKNGNLVHNGRKSCIDILVPGGKLVGTPGDSPDIREITGGVKEAEDFFLDLAILDGVDITPPSLLAKDGISVRVPEGTIAFRSYSRSGPLL